MSKELLESLGVKPVNPGACTGSWIDTRGKELVSYNPTNGEPIATVRQATRRRLRDASSPRRTRPSRPGA